MCVIALLMGSVISVLDMTSAILASFIILVAVSELPVKYSIAIYCVASILSLILLPEKSPVVYFVLFSGYYPIIITKLAKLPHALYVASKFIVFNVAIVAIYLVLLFVVGGISGFSIYSLLFFIPLNALFAIYDVSLKRLEAFWRIYLKKRFSKLLK